MPFGLPTLASLKQHGRKKAIRLKVLLEEAG
jgi:hypothetical protein